MAIDSTVSCDRSMNAVYREEDLNAFIDALHRWTNVKSRSEPTYKRGFETRAHIIKSAQLTFIRMGYIDAAVEDILREANISRGTFYSHFRSKKDVFASVVEAHIRRRLSATEVSEPDNKDYRSRVRGTITNYLTNYADTHDFSQILEQAANYDPEFREVRLVIREIFARRIERGIRRQQKLGTVSNTCNPQVQSLMILSMMTNMALVEIGWRGKKPTEEMIEAMTHFWCSGIGYQ